MDLENCRKKIDNNFFFLYPTWNVFTNSDIFDFCWEKKFIQKPIYCGPNPNFLSLLQTFLRNSIQWYIYIYPTIAPHVSQQRKYQISCWKKIIQKQNLLWPELEFSFIAANIFEKFYPVVYIDSPESFFQSFFPSLFS